MKNKLDSKLFERVKFAGKRLTGKTYGLAAFIGVNDFTFKGYCSEARESNLWPLLPSILEAFPAMSREWLYFNEGEMLRCEPTPDSGAAGGSNAPAPPAEPKKMELYERIRYLAATKKVSLAKMAKDLGIPQQTFHQWLKPGSQKNIWEHLPAILECFPDVRPAWLYMDGPPAFQDGTGPVTAVASPDMAADVEALRAEVAQLRAELREEARRNQQLRTRLLVDGVGDKDAPSATGKASGGHG